MIELICFIIFFGCLLIVFRGSPYFGLFGVLSQSMGLSLLLLFLGLPFFSLLTILIYVGGMMIVFLFSTILSAERYPSSGWRELIIFLSCLTVIIIPNLNTHFLISQDLVLRTLNLELGFRELFGRMGYITCFIAFILLVALVVVLVIGFEQSQANLRKL